MEEEGEMLFVVHATVVESRVNVAVQYENLILGNLTMPPHVWRGLRRLLGSGVVGASTDGVTMRLIDEA